MSAEDTDRRAPTAPLVLLWIAIALAPVAGTLIVLGSAGGLLRAGGALAMLAVVLVALGSVLARAGVGGRAGSDVEAYVGDAPTDMQMAVAVGARAIGIESVLGDPVDLRATGADEVTPSVAAWVDRHLAGRADRGG